MKKQLFFAYALISVSIAFAMQSPEQEKAHQRQQSALISTTEAPKTITSKPFQ